MAADSPPALVDEALDAALASRLVTVEGLTAEAMRLKGPGRGGPAHLMKCLASRGFVGAPSPSVLESRALRLLSRSGVKIERCEAVVKGFGYRLDIQLEGQVFVEVDGYAYHWSPEQKRYDDSRRNRLWLLGFTVLVYDWRTVVNQPSRLLAEVKQALETTAHGGGAGNRV
jgi:very-short-patch-repair endonuclease